MYGQVLNEKIIGITNKMEKNYSLPILSCNHKFFFEFATFHKVFQLLVY